MPVFSISFPFNSAWQLIQVLFNFLVKGSQLNLPWRNTTDDVFTNCEIDWSSSADNESPFIKNTASGAHNPERATSAPLRHWVFTEQFIFRTVLARILNSTNQSAKPTTWKWYYYSFKIFPRFWLAKSTRLIHHNQLRMTKFGRILGLARKWRQKCSVLGVNAPLTE